LTFAQSRGLPSSALRAVQGRRDWEHAEPLQAFDARRRRGTNNTAKTRQAARSIDTGLFNQEARVYVLTLLNNKHGKVYSPALFRSTIRVIFINEHVIMRLFDSFTTFEATMPANPLVANFASKKPKQKS
jgi:hypothetical protein